jgi:DNA processing protein
MDNTNLLYQVALSIIPGIGPKRTRDILDTFPNYLDVFQAPLSDFSNLPFFQRQHYKAIHSSDLLNHARQIIERCLRLNINIVFIRDQNYPHRLKKCDDAPIVLYTRGNALISNPFHIAIVGTRLPSQYGSTFLDSLFSAIEKHPVTIISGLAYGVDIIAHQLALKKSIPTVGCVAHGLHTIYPAAHKKTAKQMEQLGGVISEYPPGVFADKERFPMRNRLIAGLSDATIVVESGISGGSLITAQFAQNYNRDVFALPGKITDLTSSGCNELIYKNTSSIITSIPSLLNDLGLKQQIQMNFQEPEISSHSREIRQLLKQHRSLDYAQLWSLTQFSDNLLSAALFELELACLITKLPGNRWAYSR